MFVQDYQLLFLLHYYGRMDHSRESTHSLIKLIFPVTLRHIAIIAPSLLHGVL